MRSVVVVLPASMCAIIPMLRVRSIEICRATYTPPFTHVPTSCPKTNQSVRLPSVVRERLDGLSHAVRILFLLTGSPLIGGGIEDLVGQPLSHALLSTAPGVLRQPTQTE